MANSTADRSAPGPSVSSGYARTFRPAARRYCTHRSLLGKSAGRGPLLRLCVCLSRTEVAISQLSHGREGTGCRSPPGAPRLGITLTRRHAEGARRPPPSLTCRKQHLAVRKGRVGKQRRLALPLLLLGGGGGGGACCCQSPGTLRRRHPVFSRRSRGPNLCCSAATRRTGEAMSEGCNWQEASQAAGHEGQIGENDARNIAIETVT